MINKHELFISQHQYIRPTEVVDNTPRVAIFVYYESIKRKLKIKCIYECRCYERLQTKTKEITLLTYNGLVVELEHLKIDEKFANAMGEYVTQR